MIKVGTKEQIYSTTLMVADGQEAVVDVPVGATALKLTFTFSPPESGQEQSASWSGEGGNVRFKLVGWRNSIGTCIAEPTKFGDLGDRKLYFQLAQYLIGAQNNLVHLFVFLGAPNE